MDSRRRNVVFTVHDADCFYRAGKPIGHELTELRGNYRTVLTSALQGQAELALFGATNVFAKTYLTSKIHGKRVNSNKQHSRGYLKQLFSVHQD